MLPGGADIAAGSRNVSRSFAGRPCGTEADTFYFVIPGWSEGPDLISDAQLRIGESGDSGFDASHRPGMTEASFVARVPPTAVVLSSQTMTVESAAHSQVIAHALAPRGVIRPRFCLTFALLQNRGRGCAQCTRWCRVCTPVLTSEAPETSGIPHAMVLTVSFVLFPGTGLSCPRHSAADRTSLPGWARATFTKLDTSVGASGPHALAVRISTVRPARSDHSRINRPAIRPRARRCRVHRIPSQRS
jgi:hypothetical protein